MILKMQIQTSPLPKSWIIEEYEKFEQLTEEMKERMTEYLLSLHGIKENSKHEYMSKIKKLGAFLTQRGIMRFEDSSKMDLDLYLSKYHSEYTLNLYIYVFKSFYKFLDLPEVTSNLKFYNIELEQITPSEILTPEEVIATAKEAGKRREMYTVVILTLYESCARISELLGLKVGDVEFSSVRDKEKQRKLIATLYFKRSKGNVPKQPVTLIMFASELKRYINNHSSDSQSWLFPSPYDSKNPLSNSSVGYNLWNAGTRLGIKKRLNPHWLRHSGLSYFANSKNYNEQLLMWRAGWKNTSMAKRYIHSGAELEAKAYAERMGYVIEGEKPERLIVPKTCPHCQGLNPATNKNCDFCGMPLDLEGYKAEIEKRRNVESLYQNLQKIYKGKLTEEQKAELSHHTEILKELVKIGRDDLAAQYIEKLLGSWVRVFLTA